MASDNKLDDSGSLLMKSSGEQRGTGAGTNGALQSIKMRMRSPFMFLKNWKTRFITQATHNWTLSLHSFIRFIDKYCTNVYGNVENVGTKLLDLVLGLQMEGLFFCLPPWNENKSLAFTVYHGYPNIIVTQLIK